MTQMKYSITKSGSDPLATGNIDKPFSEPVMTVASLVQCRKSQHIK
jgi:hypothetical protein